MKILVTGGNGFIGSSLVQALHARGDRVTVIDRGPPRTDMDWSGVDYRQGDFADPAVLEDALWGCDMVCHLASTTVPGTANLDPASDVRGNLLGTMLLVDAMAKAGCNRIIYLSSGGTVYGDCDEEHVPEDAPCRPISSYGIVKFAIERFLLMCERTNRLRPIILRPSNPYGQRQGKLGLQGLVGTAIARISAGQVIEIWGDGSAVRDYIHISDLTDLMLKVADSPLTGVYNAGSGQGATVMEVLREVSIALGREPLINFSPGRAFDVKRIVLDIGLAKRTFDWSPAVSLGDGIRETLAHWDEY